MKRIILPFFLLLLLTACTSVQVEITPTALPPTSTALATPSVPTPTATSVYANFPIISPSNAARLEEINRFSKGIVNQAVWFPDGERLAVATHAGVYIYDVISGSELQLIFDNYRASKIDISPDGLWLAATDERTVRIWDFERNQEIFTLSEGQASIQQVIFSPDNQSLAIERKIENPNSEFNQRVSVELWNITTGELLYTLLDSSLHGYIPAGFSPDGKYIGVHSNATNQVDLRDASTGELIISFEGNLWFAFNPNGESIVVEAQDKSVLFDINTGQVLHEFEGEIRAVSTGIFNSTGSMINTYNDTSDMIEVWDTATGEKLFDISDHQGHIWAAFSPEENILATYGALDRTAKLWDAESGELLFSLQGYYGDLGEFSPDGRFLLEDRWFQGTVVVWDVNTGELALVLDEHTPAGTSVDFSPDGRYLVSGHAYGAVHFWAVETGEHLSTFSGFSNSVMDIQFSPDGQTIAGAGIFYNGSNDEGKINLWDVASGQSEYSWQTQNENRTWMTGTEFSADGNTLAGVANNNIIRLWDIQTQQIKSNIILPDGAGEKEVAFSPISPVIAFYTDAKIQLWDIDIGERTDFFYVPGEPSSVRGLEFSSDGGTIVAADTYTIWTWDIETNQRTVILDDSGKMIFNLAISPDGKLLAVGTSEQLPGSPRNYLYEILIVDIESQQILATISDHQNWVPKIVFSPDGRFISTASADGTVRLWGVLP